jgi:hypothetical protein
MGIHRRPVKIIAVALSLILFGVGAVPAKTVCKGTCGCVESKGCDAGLRVERPRISAYHAFDGVLSVFEPAYPYGAFAQAHRADPGCMSGILSRSCNMENPRSFDAVQGATSTAPRSERGLAVFSVSYIFTSLLEHHLISGLRVGNKMPARAAPVPIFLQSLSLLI